MLQQESKESSPYLVLARRTRPQSLKELVGQEVVENSLSAMLQTGKIPHAFLFTGTRGTGKTSTARILAKSLCCEKGPTSEPCQTCTHCHQITACAHEDIMEIDGASHTGVDNVRELNEAARFYPQAAKYKIFIIDEVHMLSTGAFNALLKTLEEPPSQVVFILATTELHKVPITIRSRCMIFSFRKVETKIISQHLEKILTKEKVTFEPEALHIIAREAKGSLRDSLSLLEQALALCGGQHLKTQTTKMGLCAQNDELAAKLFSAICLEKIQDALGVLQEAHSLSIDQPLLLETCAQFFRSAIVIKSLNNREKALNVLQLLPSEFELIEKDSLKLSQAALSEIFKALSEGGRDAARVSASLAWSEVVVVDCILKSQWLSPSELLGLISDKQLPSAEEKKNSKPISPPPQDMSFFRTFVEKVRNKSEVLAAKLTMAKIVTFDKNKIEFAQAPENSTYLALNPHDLKIFFGTLEEFDLSNIPILGAPFSKTEHNFSKNFQENIPDQKENTTKKPTKISTQSLLQNFKKASPSKAESAVEVQIDAQSTSLHQVIRDENKMKLQEKRKRLMAHENIQALANIATKIEILHIEQE